MTIPGTVLQNELEKRLPSSFFGQFPGGAAIAYSIIPLIPSMTDPMKDQIRDAFADSLKVVWEVTVLTGIIGLGLLLSLGMEKLPLHTLMYKSWGIKDKKDRPMT